MELTDKEYQGIIIALTEKNANMVAFIDAFELWLEDYYHDVCLAIDFDEYEQPKGDTTEYIKSNYNELKSKHIKTEAEAE